MTHGEQSSALSQPRGVEWVEDGGGFRRVRTCVYLWLIHADVCQESTQGCKAIILQKNLKKGETEK